MSANVQEKRKNLDELSPGQCPRCRNGGPSGDEWTVSLYWNEGEAVFHCVICGYREYVPLEGCHTGYLARQVPEEPRSGCKSMFHKGGRDGAIDRVTEKTSHEEKVSRSPERPRTGLSFFGRVCGFV